MGQVEGQEKKVKRLSDADRILLRGIQTRVELLRRSGFVFSDRYSTIVLFAPDCQTSGEGDIEGDYVVGTLENLSLRDMSLKDLTKRLG